MTLRSVRTTRWLILLAIWGLTACGDLLGPGKRGEIPDEELVVVEVDPKAPPLTTTLVSFWAVRGQERQVEIRYEATADYPEGKCLRFVVPAQALQRLPNGTPVAQGDSVRITIRVLNAGLFLFDFSPSGLAFDPHTPARLEIRYRWALLDTNGDGKVSASEASGLSLWRQEQPGLSWTRVPSTRVDEAEELRASIPGFTRYAMASD